MKRDKKLVQKSTLKILRYPIGLISIGGWGLLFLNDMKYVDIDSFLTLIFTGIAMISFVVVNILLLYLPEDSEGI